MDYCGRAEKILKIAYGHASSLLYGSSKSIIKGAGLEYIDFREYTWDDDIRYVDWRLSARNIGADGEYKLFVKEYQTERKVRTLFIVDLSGSIGFKDKFDTQMYALFLTLYLAHKLEDTVSLITLREHGYRVDLDIEPSKAIRIVKREVCKEEPRGAPSLSSILDVLKRIPRTRSLLLFTDYGHEPEDYVSIARCARARDMNSVIILITTPYELNPPLDTTYTPLYDVETGVYTVTSIKDYRRLIQDHVRSVRATLRINRSLYLELNGLRHAVRSKLSIMRTYIMARMRYLTAMI